MLSVLLLALCGRHIDGVKIVQIQCEDTWESKKSWPAVQFFNFNHSKLYTMVARWFGFTLYSWLKKPRINYHKTEKFSAT